MSVSGSDFRSRRRRENRSRWVDDSALQRPVQCDTEYEADRQRCQLVEEAHSSPPEDRFAYVASLFVWQEDDPLCAAGHLDGLRRLVS